jgi:hypothetical protein
MLEKIKLLLGITDSDKDPLLQQIVVMVTARLKALLGGIEPPESMDYIITEVSVKRFNRIGSEGLSAHSVEGESQTFTDSDFAEFADDIQAYKDSQKTIKRGKVRFI